MVEDLLNGDSVFAITDTRQSVSWDSILRVTSCSLSSMSITVNAVSLLRLVRLKQRCFIHDALMTSFKHAMTHSALQFVLHRCPPTVLRADREDSMLVCLNLPPNFLFLFVLKHLIPFFNIILVKNRR